ncbi:hypothetical protein GCM10011512_28870 [Tersicoccus solisilvae]|uniref:Cytochrome bc1 complex Rieske iron-sulfur subunit n=1 Tax=Tersicoccus solisilvae TaxID=1882339 RepID=A0ABQ1PPC6_9MICC|nr:Rieske (2Fe-2S) protein [Tersicoccus solisilvae]GGD00255.1 hypothetical protein GCM10011512_28870 [Tersicoccus solisilvae]
MEQPSPSPSRRVVITLSSSVAAAAALAACAPTNAGGSSAGGTSAPGAAPATSAGGRGPELAKASDVPVGSSKLVGSGNAQVFLSHPSADTFRAFSPSCTHQGCTVEVRSDIFHCPCHGSEFALADGAVLQGPAERPLIERKVTVADGTVYLA